MIDSVKSRNVIARYLPVYVILLAIAVLEVFLAYHPIGSRLIVLLGLAICSAGFALMYFMHLAYEKRSLLLTLVPVTIFVLLMMNMIWSDSLRLQHMRPFAH